MSENPIITQPTPEQEALIPVYQAKWRRIALSTERINREKAAEAIKAAYRLIDEDEPEILFFDSPYAAAKSFYFDICDGDISLFFALREKWTGNFYTPDYETDDIELFEIIQDVEGCILAKADELLSNDNALLCEQFYDGNMQTDILCNEFGWYDFCFNELKYDKTIEWQVYQDILEYCGRIYTYEKCCLISDRPTQLLFDNLNRLHAEGRPAVEYADDFKVYVYHGVLLPEEYGIVTVKQWKAQWLLEERNAELRRVLIQGIGYERICEELGAVELDSWKEYTLLKIENYIELNRRGSVLQEPMYLLKMICPSTGSIHILRVPPDMTSAHAAVCWINWGIQPEDFAVQS